MKKNTAFITKHRNPKIGIYSRVSSDKQVSKGISFEEQQKRGMKFANELRLPFELYSESGVSGKTPLEDKPALCRLMNDIKKENITHVYFTNQDRLTRDPSQLIALKFLFVKHKILIYENGILTDYNDPTIELLSSIKGSLADFETKQIMRRVTAVLLDKAANGGCNSGPHQPFGFTKDINKKLEIEPNEAEIVKQIYDMSLNKDMGCLKIANELNRQNIPTKRMRMTVGMKGQAMMVRGKKISQFKWSDKTVLAILKNPIYMGQRLFKGKQYPCVGIVSEDIYNQTQLKLRLRLATKNTTNKHNYLLKGVIKCKCCNSPMFGHKRPNNRDNSYKCIDSKRYFETGCTNKSINIDFIEAEIIKRLMDLPNQIKAHFDKDKPSMIKKTQTKTVQDFLERKLEIEKEIRRLIKLNITNRIARNIFDSTLNELNIELDAATKLYDQCINSFKQHEQKHLIISSVAKLVKNLNKKTFEDKKQVVHTLINCINTSYDESLNTNYIEVEYKIDSLTTYLLNSKTTVPRYRSNWIDKNKVISSTLILKK